MNRYSGSPWFARARTGAALLSAALVVAPALGVTTALPSLRIPAAAKVLSLGGAMSAYSGDLAAVWVNPAAGAALINRELGLSGTAWTPGPGKFSLLAAYPVETKKKRKLGVAEVGLSVYSLGIGDEEEDYERDAAGELTDVELTARDIYASVGFATSLGNVNLGASGWFVSSQLTSAYPGTAYGGNVGAQYSFNFLYFGKPVGETAKPEAATGKKKEASKKPDEKKSAAAKPSKKKAAAKKKATKKKTSGKKKKKASTKKSSSKKKKKKTSKKSSGKKKKKKKKKKKESPIAKLKKMLRDVETPNTTVGLSAVNLGAGPTYDQEAAAPPMLVQGGLSYQPIRELRFLADGGYALTEKSAIAGAGVEYIIKEMVAVRAGVRYDRDELGFAGGLGYRGTFGALRGKIDYGIAPQKGAVAALVHSASLHVEF